MEKLDFSRLSDDMKPFETALLVSATREGALEPHTVNRPIHLSFTRMDETSTGISSAGDITHETSVRIKGVLYFGLDTIIYERDSVVVAQKDNLNNTLAVYTGRVGTPTIYRSRKACIFDILQVQQGLPTPTIAFVPALVTEPSQPLDRLVFVGGYSAAYIDGELWFGDNFGTRSWVDDYGEHHYQLAQLSENEPREGFWFVSRETGVILTEPKETRYFIIGEPTERAGFWTARAAREYEIEVYNEINGSWGKNERTVPISLESDLAQYEWSYFNAEFVTGVDDYGNPEFGYIAIPIVAGVIIRRVGNPDKMFRISNVTRIQENSVYWFAPARTVSWYVMTLESFEWE